MKHLRTFLFVLLFTAIVSACTDADAFTVSVDGKRYRLNDEILEMDGRIFVTAEDLVNAFGIFSRDEEMNGDITFVFYIENFSYERKLSFTENTNSILLDNSTDYRKYYDESVMIIQDDVTYIDLEAFCDSAFYKLEFTDNRKANISYFGISWKKIYYDYLNSKYMRSLPNTDRISYFGIADIDNNGIPELFTGYQMYNEPGTMLSFIPELDSIVVDLNYFGQPYLADPEGVYICTGTNMRRYGLHIGEDIDIGLGIIFRHFPFVEGSSITNLDEPDNIVEYTEEKYAEFKTIINEDTNILKYELTLENIEMLLGDYE